MGARPVAGSDENGHRQTPKIGIFGPEEGARGHAEILRGLGVETVEAREVADLEGLGGIIVAGGDPTTMGETMVSSGLFDGIRSFFYQGGPLWGTCAGMVLAASAATGERQPLLGVMNALVVRDGFGEQVDSFEKDLDVEGFDEPFTGIFIRAPFYEDVGPGVEVLSEVGGKAVAARGENILVTAFRPELTDDARFHEYFLKEVCGIERS